MSTKCDCNKPPGGSTECPPNTMAVCRNVNGECHGSCYELPKFSNRQVWTNFILEKVKDESRDSFARISFEDEKILRSNRYNYMDLNGNRIQVRFSLPKNNNLGGQNDEGRLNA